VGWWPWSALRLHLHDPALKLDPVDPAGVKGTPLAQLDVHNLEIIQGRHRVLDGVAGAQDLAFVAGIEGQLALGAVCLDEGDGHHAAPGLVDHVADSLVVGHLPLGSGPLYCTPSGDPLRGCRGICLHSVTLPWAMSLTAGSLTQAANSKKPRFPGADSDLEFKG